MPRKRKSKLIIDRFERSDEVFRTILVIAVMILTISIYKHVDETFILVYAICLGFAIITWAYTKFTENVEDAACFKAISWDSLVIYMAIQIFRLENEIFVFPYTIFWILLLLHLWAPLIAGILFLSYFKSAITRKWKILSIIFMILFPIAFFLGMFFRLMVS